MVKKSKGFNWGPAATALSRWTGVRLSVLLKHCCIQSPQQVPLDLTVHVGSNSTSGDAYLCFCVCIFKLHSTSLEF